jgi:hypothetical protein
LDSLIGKYSQNGFNLDYRKPRNYGTAYILKKGKHGLLRIPSEEVLIFHVNGDLTLPVLKECLAEYNNYYLKYGGMVGKGNVHGIVAVSGSANNRDFEIMRTTLITDKRVFDTLSLELLEKPSGVISAIMTSAIPSSVSVAERNVGGATPTKYEDVLSTIASIGFLHETQEQGYERQLWQALSSKFRDVEYDESWKDTGFEIVIGKNEVGVKLRIIWDAAIFDQLFSQVHRWKDDVSKIVVVLIDELRNPSTVKKEIERLRSIDPAKVSVVIK